MSWGFFMEVQVELPTAAWRAIEEAPASDWPAEPGFLGLAEESLEQLYLAPSVADWTFRRTLDALATWESVVSERADGDRTHVRVVVHLDKGGETYFARPLASLLLAAKDRGGSGRVVFANDGTYSGEDGVILTLADGAIRRGVVDDCWEEVERLGGEIYGDLEGLDDAPPKKAKKPAAKKVVKKTASKKKVAKKRAKKVKEAAKKVTKPTKKMVAKAPRRAPKAPKRAPKAKRTKTKR